MTSQNILFKPAGTNAINSEIKKMQDVISSHTPIVPLLSTTLDGLSKTSVISLRVDRKINDDQSAGRINTYEEISSGEATPHSFFRIKMSANRLDNSTNGNTTTIEQVFDVNENCGFDLANTTYSGQSFAGRLYNLKNILVVKDGTAPGAEKLTERRSEVPSDILMPPESLAPNPNLYDLTLAVDRFKGKKIGFFLTSAPLFTYFLEIRPDEQHVDFNDGKLKSFHRAEMSLAQLDTQPFAKAQLFHDDDGHVFTVIAGEVTWSITSENRWNELHVLASKRGVIELDPSTKIDGDLRVEIKSTVKIDYPNLSSYWENVQQSAETEAPWLIKYVYHVHTIQYDEGDPLIQNPQASNDPYLAESAGVQVSNLEIQEKISQLKKLGKLSRMNMAKEILKIIPQLLTYDQGQTENLIQLLSTSDILKRQKGVCQHFANVFAAIARGIGIPTRIVEGVYFDTGTLGLHAWDEIKIKEGNWMPVEPQAKGLNSQFAAYIPMAIDKEEETLSFDAQDIQSRYNMVASRFAIGLFREAKR